MKVTSAQKKEAQFIFEKWKSSLAERDRSASSLSENFSDLFFDLRRIALPYEEAHDYLERAYSAHLPRKEVIQRTYKHSPNSKYQTVDEFKQYWFDFIRDKAVNAFHEYFDIPIEDGKSEQEVRKEKAITKKSAAIREYMSNYEEIDLSSLRKSMEEEKKRLAEEGDDLLLELGVF